MSVKRANAEHPIHELLEKRWSPRAFSDRPVEREKLLSLLEAARWAPSCFNEQPWKYMITNNKDTESFQSLLDCLTERNRMWAQHAPVLMVSIAKLNFDNSGKPNRYSWHDVGQATANMTFQATAMGLFLHQMAGFDREAIRNTCKIPEGYEPVDVMALGYPGNLGELPETFRKGETSARTRKPLSDFIFTGAWNHTGELIKDKEEANK